MGTPWTRPDVASQAGCAHHEAPPLAAWARCGSAARRSQGAQSHNNCSAGPDVSKHTTCRSGLRAQKQKQKELTPLRSGFRLRAPVRRPRLRRTPAVGLPLTAPVCRAPPFQPAQVSEQLPLRALCDARPARSQYGWEIAARGAPPPQFRQHGHGAGVQRGVQRIQARCRAISSGGSSRREQRAPDAPPPAAIRAQRPPARHGCRQRSSGASHVTRRAAAALTLLRSAKKQIRVERARPPCYKLSEARSPGEPG